MLLRRLTEASGVSGYESEVRDLLRAEISGRVDEIRVDNIGNLIATKRGPEGSPRIMIAAHMDEIGLIISHIDKSGLLRFKKVGGIDDRVLVAKTVLVGPNKVPGVVGAKPIHLQEEGETEKPFRHDQLYIDIGAKSREEAEEKVKLGDAACFATTYDEFGRVVKAKALDDRIGCTILAEILKDRYDLTIHAVFTVQEEVGCRGAAVAAYALSPDLGLVLEGTTCADIPGTPEQNHTTSLGAGPAISLMDATSIANKRIVQELARLAEDNQIPYQFRRTTFGGNDAGRIHLTREGIPSGSLSVPCRYIHSPVSFAHLDDFENAKKLLGLFLQTLAKGEFKP